MHLQKFFILSGFIGKITLQIPLSRLHSEPWVISMERLYLVAGPLNDVQVSELYCNGPKFSNIQNVCCNYPKIKSRGISIEFVQEVQTSAIS